MTGLLGCGFVAARTVLLFPLPHNDSSLERGGGGEGRGIGTLVTSDSPTYKELQAD